MNTLFQRIVIVGVGVLVGCSSVPERAANRASSKPIFREVKINNGVVLKLGSKVDPQSYATPVSGDTLLRLQQSRFAAAEAIFLHLSPTRILKGMTYDYGIEPDSSFERRINEYVELLGAPAEMRQRNAGERDVVWQDAMSRFELQRRVRIGGFASRAVLLDLE